MSKIQKWGNSLAVRIPSALADQLDIRAGMPVDVSTKNGAILVCPKKRPKYRLGDLLKECKASNLHGETDFGPDVGREVLD